MKTILSKAAVLIAFTLVTQMAFSTFPTYAKDNPATLDDKPQIANGPVAEYIVDTGARIGWSTEEKTHMRVRFGTDPAHLDKIADAVEKARGRNHHANLDGLKPDTQYFFQVATRTNKAVGGIGTFRTLPSGAGPVAQKLIVP